MGLTRTDRATFFGDGTRDFKGVAKRDVQENRKHVAKLRKRKRNEED